MELANFRTPLLVRIMLVLLTPHLLGSCSLFIAHKPTIRMSDPTSPDEVVVYDWYGETVRVARKKNFKANSRNNWFYTVERKKKGYITDYRTLYQNTVNPIWLAEAGVFGLGAILMLVGAGGNGSVALVGSAMFGMGFYGTVIGKKKTFKGEFPMDPMTPVPERGEGQMGLYVDKVSVDLESGKVETRIYKNITKFRSNLTETGDLREKKKRVSERFSVRSMENIDSSIELNEVLTEAGFRDSVSTLSSLGNKANVLEARVVKLNFHYISGGVCAFEVSVAWDVKDNISRESILSTTTTTTSDIVVSRSKNALFRKGFINALTKGMVQVMESGEFTSAMEDKRKRFQAAVDGWSPIGITPGKYLSQKVSESSRSVATVKTKEGHGSGVFVSADGYLVTNLHVTGKQTDDLEIILGDGSKLKGRVERSNPVYDLALVKVEGFKGKPIAINTTRDIDLGDQVFAVGTPTEVALGQTVTSGIISSTRNFGDLDYLQTDVSINRGNSGGALLNEKGHLVGIVNAKVVGTGVEGVGFAIPAYYLEEALKLVLR